MSPRSKAFTMFACLLVAGLPSPGRSETFLQSDDYDEEDEIVGKLLKDDDYRIMVSELSRNGADLDWGWALTPDWESSKKTDATPKKLGFSFSSYKTIHVPPPTDHVSLTDGERDAVHEALMRAMETVGLEVIADAEAADLVLASAIVDLSREGGGFGWIQVDPFIEVELRLTDRAAGKDLLLIRDQAYGDGPERAATDLGSELTKFLR